MPLPNKSLVARNVAISKATTPVRYLTPEEVRQREQAALRAPKKGDRDALLIRVLFQGGLRISEAISLTPTHVEIFEGRPCFRFIGKGSKPRRVACPVTLAESLQAYAFKYQTMTWKLQGKPQASNSKKNYFWVTCHYCKQKLAIPPEWVEKYLERVMPGTWKIRRTGDH